jgi:Protein of unknown function (DUF2508)
VVKQVSLWGRKTRTVVEWNQHVLDESVNRARQDWQHARYLMEICEPDGRVDEAIYNLQLSEKRYMYLLTQAKRERDRDRQQA